MHSENVTNTFGPNMSHNIKVAVLIGAIGLFAGCKKSPEAAKKEWNQAVEDAQKYSSKYPAAKAAIDDLKKKAEADFEEAKKADSKTQGDKMSAAADELSSPLKVFANYEDEWKKLSALQTDKELMSMSAADFNPLNKAADDAKKQACCILQPTEKVCSDLVGTCPTPAPTIANMGDLKAKLEPAVAAMDAAQKGLAAKKKPAAPAGSAAGSAAAAPAGSAAPAPAGSAAGSAK